MRRFVVALFVLVLCGLAPGLTSRAQATVVDPGGGGCSYTPWEPYVSFGYSPPFGIVAHGSVYCSGRYDYKVCLQVYDWWYGTWESVDTGQNWGGHTGCVSDVTGWGHGYYASGNADYYAVPDSPSCPGIDYLFRTWMHVAFQYGGDTYATSDPVEINC
jgi:hypothetical protein